MAIMKNERPRSALNFAEEYERLKRRDRRAVWAGEISERHFAALREAKMPDWCSDLDAELEDWKP
jgi:hypothetical protein